MTKRESASALLIALAFSAGCTQLNPSAQTSTETNVAQTNTPQTNTAQTNQSSRRARAPQQYPFVDDPRLRKFFGLENTVLRLMMY